MLTAITGDDFPSVNLPTPIAPGRESIAPIQPGSLAAHAAQGIRQEQAAATPAPSVNQGHERPNPTSQSLIPEQSVVVQGVTLILHSSGVLVDGKAHLIRPGDTLLIGSAAVQVKSDGQVTIDDPKGLGLPMSLQLPRESPDLPGNSRKPQPSDDKKGISAQQYGPRELPSTVSLQATPTLPVAEAGDSMPSLDAQNTDKKLGDKPKSNRGAANRLVNFTTGLCIVLFHSTLWLLR
jgi:hypothetical protein